MKQDKSPSTPPTIILHGGAGNITSDNLPTESYNAYRHALLSVLREANVRLRLPNAKALDVATYAVSLLENDPLFNAGHGAVFTTVGTHELEASVMVSRGYRKRGVGVMKVTKAKNPIKLAKEMLRRGEEDDGGGAQGHCQLEGETCDRLTQQWQLETVKPGYFWTRKRWDQHRRGLGKKHDDDTYKRHKQRAGESTRHVASIEDEQIGKGTTENDDMIDETSWDGREYLPQGTVGAVVLDSNGTLCVATSTGGLTNKLPGRIGDSPTLGSGFWAESWTTTDSIPAKNILPMQFSYHSIIDGIKDCFPGFSSYMPIPPSAPLEPNSTRVEKTRAVAMSGTGNGDSFLKLNAVRTTAAIARFSSHGFNAIALQDAITRVAGPNGMLQQSAEDRWEKTGEGEGGIIGIDFKDGQGKVVSDFNCGGMFHAWVDENTKERFRVFREDG